MSERENYDITDINGDTHGFTSLEEQLNFVNDNTHLFFDLPFIPARPATRESEITLPHHYHKGGIDLLTFIKNKISNERQAGFHQINVLKYVLRYEEKGGIDDLYKARDYLNKLIKLEEEQQDVMAR